MALCTPRVSTPRSYNLEDLGASFIRARKLSCRFSCYLLQESGYPLCLPFGYFRCTYPLLVRLNQRSQEQDHRPEEDAHAAHDLQLAEVPGTAELFEQGAQKPHALDYTTVSYIPLHYITFQNITLHYITSHYIILY